MVVFLHEECFLHFEYELSSGDLTQSTGQTCGLTGSNVVMSTSEKLEPGKWIAVVKRDILKGTSAKEVFEKAKEKYPDKEPFIMKVPENSIMLL